MRAQRGQAIVIIGVVMLALCGIAALAIDAGRAYADRRQVQAASDAAALGAAGDYHVNHSLTRAVQHGAQFFADNIGVTAAIPEPGSTPATFTWGDYQVTITPVPQSGTGMRFDVVATHRLPVALMKVLGVGPYMQIGTDAQAVTDMFSTEAAMIALSQDGCTPGQDAIQMGGNANITIKGDVYSNGNISVANNVHVTLSDGTAFYHCGSSPSGLTPNQQAGLISVNYPIPVLTDSTPRTLTSGVDARPGAYNSFSIRNNTCYFLTPGVYGLTGGISMNGGVVSDELRSPDEASPNDRTKAATTPLWASCNASLKVTTPTGGNVPHGQYSVRVTSVRSDVGVNRESPPSRCYPVTLNDDTHGIKVEIPNSPGAQGYNIYVASGDCSAAFHYATSSGPISDTTKKDGSTWAPAVTLGTANLRLGAVLGSCATRPAPWAIPAAGTTCAPPSDARADGTAPPLSQPAPLDLANENLFAAAAGDAQCGSATPTPPGGVALVLAGGQSVSQTGGTMYLFGTERYCWMLLSRAPSPQTVNDTLNGNGSSKFFGTVYLPNSNLTIAGGNTAPFVGQLIAYTIKVTGGSGVLVQVDTNRMPPPPPARLVQ